MWSKSYPNVKIDCELAKMSEWLTRPKNVMRKGSRQFIANWLSRAAESAPDQPQTEPEIDPEVCSDGLLYTTPQMKQAMEDFYERRQKEELEQNAN